MTDADKFLKTKCITCKTFENARISKEMCEYHIIATCVDAPNHRHCNRDCWRFKKPSADALKKARKVRGNGKYNEIYAKERQIKRFRRIKKTTRNKEIIAKLNAGRMYKDVAREYGLNINTLYNLRRATAMKMRKPRTEKQTKEILRLIEVGTPYREIAKKCDVALGTIYNVMKEG